MCELDEFRDQPVVINKLENNGSFSELDQFPSASFCPQSLRRWNSVLACGLDSSCDCESLNETNSADGSNQTLEAGREPHQQLQALLGKSASFQTGKQWRTRNAMRRHSIAIGAYNQSPLSEFDKTRSRRGSVCSDISVASFAGREYSSMMAAWVDDGFGDLEDNLMVLSANDFRIIALAPLREGSQPPRSESCSSASTEPRQEVDSKPSSSEEAASCHLPANEVVDTPAERREAFQKSSSTSCLLPRKEREIISKSNSASCLMMSEESRPASKKSGPKSGNGAASTKHGHRRSSLLKDLSQWPVYSGGAEELARVRRTLDSFAFCAMDYTQDDLCVILAEIFYEMELDVRLQISRSAVQGFIMAARARMLDNAYHNWTHVVDVTQTVYALARLSGVYETLTDKQRLVLFLAALCHDLEHPGVTAGYLLKSESKLAARYKKDLGLLEKHHSIRAFQLLACHDINLLRALPNPDKLDVTSMVRDVIMATDMRHHADYFDAVKSRIASPSPPSESPSSPPSSPAAAGGGPASDDGKTVPAGGAGEGEDGGLLHLQLLLKCADISNVLKPFPVAREWAVRVTEEFFSQGDLERANGLDVTPMCDRERQSRVALQKGFIDHVAGPFHRGVAELLPRLRPLLAQMDENRRAWDTVTDDMLVNVVMRRKSY